MECLPSGLELHIHTYLDENEDKTANKRYVSLNACTVCVKPYTLGKKGCCSTNCYLQVLQIRLDDCCRRDTSHTKLLSL